MKSLARTGSPWRTTAAVVLAALVPILVFWRGALLRGVFFQADLVVYYLPAYAYATRVLRTGIVPLWAPEMEGGQPFHAQWEPTLLYPLVVPFRFLLPPWWALNLSLIFHYALAAVGMFAFARRLSLSRSAALVSAAIYSVNGFMMAHLEHPNLIVGAAWLPWLLLCVDYGLAGKALAGALGMGAVLGMTLLGGHPDMFLMGALVVGFMVLGHPVHGVLRKRRWRDALPPLGMLIGGYALGLALAAAQILPTLDLARLSWERHGASVGYQDVWSLRPQQFLGQLLPDLFGRNGQDTYWGMAHYWEECSYVGALALALAVVGLFTRHRMARFYGGLAVLSVWLAMGTNSAAFLVLRQLPAFGTMRLPCRYMFLFDLSIAVLAGIGAHWLSRCERLAVRNAALRRSGLTAAALSGAALWVFAGWLPRLATVRQSLRLAHHFHTSQIGPLLHRYDAQLRLDAALLAGGLLLAIALVWAATRGRRLRRAISPVAFVGVVATLFVFGSSYHTVIPPRWISLPPFTVAAIRATAPATPFRVLQWDSLKLHSEVAVHRGWWPTDARGYRQYVAALPGNSNLIWGLSGVRQEEWSALPLRYTRQLTSAILALGDRSGLDGIAPYLQWLNAGYVVSQRPLHDASLTLLAADRIHLYRTRDPGRRVWIVHQAAFAPSDEQLLQQLTSSPQGLMDRVMLEMDESAKIFRAKARKGRKREIRTDLGKTGKAHLPPFRFVPSLPSRFRAQSVSSFRRPSEIGPVESARIVSRAPTRVTVQAVLARDGFLVLGESWAPGWRAWVDGRPAPVLRANFIHRAVPVPAGRHRVEFRYVPAAFRLGLYVSAIALGVLLALTMGQMGARR